MGVSADTPEILLPVMIVEDPEPVGRIRLTVCLNEAPEATAAKVTSIVEEFRAPRSVTFCTTLSKLSLIKARF
jgi:hypothetical protein